VLLFYFIFIYSFLINIATWLSNHCLYQACGFCIKSETVFLGGQRSIRFYGTSGIVCPVVIVIVNYKSSDNDNNNNMMMIVHIDNG